MSQLPLVAAVPPFLTNGRGPEQLFCRQACPSEVIIDIGCIAAVWRWMLVEELKLWVWFALWIVSSFGLLERLRLRVIIGFVLGILFSLCWLALWLELWKGLWSGGLLELWWKLWREFWWRPWSRFCRGSCLCWTQCLEASPTNSCLISPGTVRTVGPDKALEVPKN